VCLEFDVAGGILYINHRKVKTKVKHTHEKLESKINIIIYKGMHKRTKYICINRMKNNNLKTIT